MQNGEASRRRHRWPRPAPIVSGALASSSSSTSPSSPPLLPSRYKTLSLSALPCSRLS
uniref:Uncharacterized protein n=1 Tax=Arundo donax TaxID=35708 RepID=A0A0A9AMQ9_ARUDO